MKIFVSSSRRDAEFAEQISKNFQGAGHDIFSNVNSIEKYISIRNNTIEKYISLCDIFVLIVTYDALESPHVEKEVLQARKEKKKIIPCLYRNVRKDDIK